MALAFERPPSRNIPKMDPSLQRPRSALVRGVQITELSDGCTNPEPVVLQESDILMEQHLSVSKLQVLTGCDNLDKVTTLELKVDTSETTLNNFGAMLPNLTVLKLSGSVIANIRDLGSCLRNLKVLWMSRCGLEELDGISSMLKLQELYLAYNEISDISPLSMLEELEILDLEGNNVDDIGQVQYLTLCPKLNHLTLDGNPICVTPTADAEEVNYDYRQAVKKILADLSILDDKSFADADNSSNQNVFDADWAYLEELQSDALIMESMEKESGDRPGTAALKPATAYRPGSALRPSSGFRPLSSSHRPASISGGRPSSAWTENSKRRPASSDAVDGMESASDLTCGVVICGNPSKALRSRRKVDTSQESVYHIEHSMNAQRLPEGKTASQLEAEGASETAVEGGRSVEGDSAEDQDLTHLMQELQSWKQEHEKRLEKIRESKAPQVLRIDYSSDSSLSAGDSDNEEFDLQPDLALDQYCSQQAHNSYRSQRSDAATLAEVPYSSRDESLDTAIFSQDKMVETPATRKLNQTNTQKLSQTNTQKLEEYEKSLGTDDHLIREYERLQALEKKGEKVHISETPLREQGRLRELRVPSAGPRPNSPYRGLTPRTDSFAVSMTDPSFAFGQESLHHDRPRKIKIGPTGLPGSSHSQQPQIRDILTPQSKPGFGGLHPSPGQRPPSSSGLQHKMRRTLPEVPSLPSRPPPVTKS